MSESFSKSMIQISIPEFSEKYVNKQTVTYYKINCTNIYSNIKWGFEKSYDDFVNLHSNLIKVLPNIPKLEGKSFFKVTSFDELNKRKIYLENYLKQCLSRKDIISNDYFKDFLDLEKHSPELLLNKPIQLSQFNDLPIGVRDMIYIKESEIMLIICSEMHITNRMDAYITNVNLPWEAKTDSHISVGGFFVYKVKYHTTRGLLFDKIYAQSYSEQTGVLNYNRESNTINIGLDTGRIIFYKVDPDSDFQTIENYIDFKPHSNRVMGLAYEGIYTYIII